MVTRINVVQPVVHPAVHHFPVVAVGLVVAFVVVTFVLMRRGKLD